MADRVAAVQTVARGDVVALAAGELLESDGQDGGGIEHSA
jgi:hypothetical protein